MKIGIIILNWNGLALLQRYLPSVVKYSQQHTIYVADNASTDDSIAWTQEHFPTVHIIAMDKNRGYAGGYNKAVQQVDENLLCLLNNDIEVTANWLEPIIKLFTDNKDMAVAQPLLLDDKKRTHFEYAGAAGGYLDRLAYPYCRGRIFNNVEENINQFKNTLNLDWASGAAFFVRKEAFLEIEGFDEDYFAHQEEIDVCWRLRHLGYSIGIATDSIVYHLGGGTLKALSPMKTFYNFRNSLFNIVKNDHGSGWFIRLIIRMILDGVAGLRFLLSGKLSHFIAILKAHGAFYAGISTMLKKRKTVKDSSKGNIEKLNVYSIVYQYFIKKEKLFKN